MFGKTLFRSEKTFSFFFPTHGTVCEIGCSCNCFCLDLNASSISKLLSSNASMDISSSDMSCSLKEINWGFNRQTFHIEVLAGRVANSFAMLAAYEKRFRFGDVNFLIGHIGKTYYYWVYKGKTIMLFIFPLL